MSDRSSMLCDSCESYIKELKPWQEKVKKKIFNNCNGGWCAKPNYCLKGFFSYDRNWENGSCPYCRKHFLSCGGDIQTECSEFWCTRGKLFANTPQHKTGWTIITILALLLITSGVIILKKKEKNNEPRKY